MPGGIGCDQSIFFRCDKDPYYSLAAGDRWILKRDIGGANFQALNVRLDEAAPDSAYVSLTDGPRNSGTIESYVVCEQRAGLELCSSLLQVQTADNSVCNPPTSASGGANVNVGTPTCGVPPLPRCKTIAPAPPTDAPLSADDGSRYARVTTSGA